jgi:predicted permease
METLLYEIRYAARNLHRSPGFALVAIMTLALGIGANTALFSLVYGVLLRPLDYRDADRLVAFKVERDFAGRPAPVPANFSLPDLDVWQARGRSFESAVMSAGGSALLAGESGNEVVGIATVTPPFFTTIGGRFALGRGLGPSDDGSPSVVISHRLWQRLFAGAPTAIGREIVLDRQPYSIVGVADATFQLPSSRIDVWRTVGFARSMNPELAGPRAGGFQLIARLRPDATIEQARTESAEIAARLDPQLHALPIPLRDWFLTGPVTSTLLVLWTAVGLVLFVACANVTNLIVARDAARSRETSVRIALGASRGRLIGQALAHGGLLAAGGVVGGSLLAMAIVAAVIDLQPAGIPRLDAVHVDLPVLLFAAALGTLTTLIVGVVPAFQTTDIAAALKTSGPNAAGDRHARRARRTLVVAELAVSVVLLVGASLLGRSLTRLMHTDIGVSTDHVTAALVDLSFGRRLTMAAQRTLIDSIVDRVRVLPGVTKAGAGASMPPNRARLRFTMNRFDDARGQPSNYMVDAVTATPGYFSALGIRLQQGRFFTDADAADGPAVMIMTASTARQVFGPGNAIGRTISLPVLAESGTKAAPIALVGIVDDVRYSGLETPANAVIYRPFAQQPWPSMFIVARTAQDPTAFAATLRRVITSVDPAIGISTIDTLQSMIDDAAAQSRFRTVTLMAVAMLATALAAIGLYGVIAYAVTQRTTEIGIRMALGAARGDVTRLIVGEGMALVAGGLAIGVGVGRAFTHVIAGLLYGVEASDPVSFVVASVGLCAAAIAAMWIPARRATRVDPAVALRQS